MVWLTLWLLWLKKNTEQANSFSNERWKLKISQEKQNGSSQFLLAEGEKINRLIQKINEGNELQTHKLIRKVEIP